MLRGGTGTRTATDSVFPVGKRTTTRVPSSVGVGGGVSSSRNVTPDGLTKAGRSCQEGGHGRGREVSLAAIRRVGVRRPEGLGVGLSLTGM